MNTELRQALNRILHQHGQSPGHDYAHRWQLLAVDFTGLGGGRKVKEAHAVTSQQLGDGAGVSWLTCWPICMGSV